MGFEDLTESGSATDLTAPGEIGGTTPAAATFTDLTATGNSDLGDASSDVVAVAGKLNGDASGTTYLNIGSGASAANLGTPQVDDVYVEGRLEVDGHAYLDNGATYGSNNTQKAGTFGFWDNLQINMGTNGDTREMYSSFTTPPALIKTTGAQSNSIIFCANAGYTNTWDHALQTNPTFYFQSASTTAADHIALSHNQTDGVIATGTGGVKLNNSVVLDSAKQLTSGEFPNSTTLYGWNMDATAADSAGAVYGNGGGGTKIGAQDLTVRGAAFASATDQLGNTKYCQFGGSTYANSSDAAFNMTGDFSCGGWVYLADWSSYGGADFGFMSRYSTNGWIIAFDDSDARMQFLTFSGGATSTHNVPTTGLSAGWHHVVFVRDSGTDNKCYVDGELFSTNTDASDAITAAGNFEIGGYADSAHPPSGVRMDELFVHNATVLSADEVKKIYAVSSRKFAVVNNDGTVLVDNNLYNDKTDIVPDGDNLRDIGTGANSFKDAHIQGTANIGIVSAVSQVVAPATAITGIAIDQDEDAAGLTIDCESVSAFALQTTGKYPALVTQDLPDGIGLRVTRDNADAESASLVEFYNDNASDTFPTLALGNDGSGAHITTRATNEDLEIAPNGTGGTVISGLLNKTIDVVQASDLNIADNDTLVLTFDFVPTTITLNWSYKGYSAANAYRGNTTGNSVVQITGTDTMTVNTNATYYANENSTSVNVNGALQNDTTNTIYGYAGVDTSQTFIVGVGTWNTSNKQLTITFQETGTTTAQNFVQMVATAVK